MKKVGVPFKRLNQGKGRQVPRISVRVSTCSKELIFLCGFYGTMLLNYLDCDFPLSLYFSCNSTIAIRKPLRVSLFKLTKGQFTLWRFFQISNWSGWFLFQTEYEIHNGNEID